MKILIGAPVRQSKEIFELYLESLNNLEIPEGCEVKKAFIFDNCPELKECLGEDDLYTNYFSHDEYKVDETTHHWDWSKPMKVGRLKNFLLQKTIDIDFDYFLLVDSDLILHPKTLVQLLSAKKDLVAEIFWTRWTPEDIESPNAWDYNSYEFKHENRLSEWKTPGLYETGMSGACFLISKKVIQSGVLYEPIHNLNIWGEDRWFCIRAAVHGFKVYLDTHYPATHLYRPSDVDKYKQSKGGG